MKLNMDVLRQPFPLNPGIQRKVFTSACFGLFVTLFLLLFKPFHLATLETNKFVFACVAYGVIAFVGIIIMVVVVPFIFPSFFKEDRWTVGREIFYLLCIVFFIGIINYVLSPFLVGSSLNVRNIPWFQFITISIAALPITIYVLNHQNRQLKKYSSKAASLQEKISEMNDPETDKKKIIDQKLVIDEQITLKGEYQKEKIVVSPGNLFYISTANNYVKIFYLENNKIVYSIIRITMKKVEDLLLPFPNFFRCHRAFIINLSKVKEVIGNAQGYKVKIHEVEEMIPVSRNLNSEFSDKLLSRKFE